MSLVRIGLLSVVALIGSAALCRADVAAVNRYLGEAKELIDKGGQFFDDAGSKLELAEASLDDVPAGEKPALAAKIKELRDQMTASTNALQKGILERDLKEKLERIEQNIGNLVTWSGDANELRRMLDDPKTTELLGADAVAAARKQFETFERVNAGKALKDNLASATTAVTELETEWNESKEKIKDPDLGAMQRQGEIESTQRSVTDIDRLFRDLPADNADVKALRDRIARISAEASTMLTQAGADGVTAKITEWQNENKENFAGMEQETAGPTWAQYKSVQSGNVRQFNAPKSVEFLRTAPYFLRQLAESDGYKENKDHPQVKAAVTELQTKIAATRARVAALVGKVVDELTAEKVSEATISDAVVMRGSITNTFDEGAPEATALIARVDAAIDAYRNAGEAASAAMDAYYKTMTEQANKQWPGMMAKFTIAEGFDPANPSAMKGQIIKITGYNRMGWDYKGELPFATTINGLPVAAKYEQIVADALKEAGEKSGHTIGDRDDDGEWTVIARVEGTIARITQIVRHEGDVTVDGTNVGTVRGTEDRPIDVPLLTVLALKAGPVAVAKDQGAVKADGSVAAPTPAGGSAATGGTSSGGMGIFGRLIGIVSALLGFLLGAACLIRMNVGPFAAKDGSPSLEQKVGAMPLLLLGVVGIALGAIGLLMGLIGLFSAPLTALLTLITSAAMIVAGLVCASATLETKGIVKPEMGKMIKMLALPAGALLILFSFISLINCLIP